MLRQITKKNIRYVGNKSDIGAWKNFMSEYPNAGEEFVNRYIEYGLQSWFNESNARDHSKTIRFAWIFGKGAIRRWNALGSDTAIHVTRIGIKKEHKLKVRREKSPRLTALLIEVRESEEKYKERFYNTKRGLLWCIANTTLFHHRSQLCLECENRAECKKTLELEMNAVYKLRGYGDS